MAASRQSRQFNRRTVLRGCVAAPVCMMASPILGPPSGNHTAVPPARSQPPVALAAGARGRDLQQALDSLIGAYDDPAEKAVAALGSVSGQGLGWQGAAGYADRDGRHRAHPGFDYQYRIGSTTKTFTATVVLQLVGEGLVALDDPIGRHVPGAVPAQDRITVRHLLGMTSGLHDYLPLLLPSLGQGRSSHREYREATSQPIAPQELISRAAIHGLKFEPGEAFDYSTTNYLVLGLLIEQVTGNPYRHELRRRIVRPLCLRRTDLPDGPELELPHLHGYAHFDDRPEEWTDVSARYEHGWAGGGMVSTRADLARFISALLAGQLLEPDLLAAMKTPSGAPPANDGAPPGAPSGQTYGLGLHRDDGAPSGPMWGNGGDTHGYNTRLLATPDGRTRILATKTGFPTRRPTSGDPFELFIHAAYAAIRDG